MIVLFTWLLGLRHSDAKKKWLLVIVDLLTFMASGIALFYWFWGFNYSKPSLSASYFEYKYTDIDTTEFKKIWARQGQKVNYLRGKSTEPDSSKNWTAIYSHHLQKSIKTVLPIFNIDSSLNPICKELSPQGSLLRLNTAGFYFPYGSESYIDPGLHISQKPFVIAHELAHGYGVTDEGDANFLGYLTCLKSGDRFVQYSAELGLWLYMARDARGLDKNYQTKMWKNLSQKVQDDLAARQMLDQTYPAIMPTVRDFIYGSYLSLNQVEGGLESYSRLVKMVITYNKEKQKR
ncbi:DUF3810 domain-containing protein [Membranihabitans marinus]